MQYYSLLHCLLVDEETDRPSSGPSRNEDQYTSPTVSVEYYDEIWTPPDGWDGPDAVLYRSFDDVADLIFMEGDERVNIVPIVG